MTQTLTLSPSCRAVVETSLKRMVVNAYGAMATLPLYCVGELSTSESDSMVMERYEVWHSFLVVAREMLRSTSFFESAKVPVDSLFEVVDHLRDAFLKLLHSRTMNRAAVRVEYERFVRA